MVGTLNQAGYGLEEIYRAFAAARGNGDLFQITDDDGRTWIGINNRWKLREKIESNLSRVDDPREEVIGLANDRVQQLRLRSENDE